MVHINCLPGDAVLYVNRRMLVAFAAMAMAPLGIPWAAAQGAPFDGRRVLVMVDDPGCIYCAKWRREVEQSYRNSDEGQFAPLEVRQRGHADLKGVDRVVYTPTFLLFNNGREEGRIIGYAGADWFWGELGSIYTKAGFKPGQPATLRTEERRI